MGAKKFEQVAQEIKGKSILVANRGIPARRVVRAIRETFQAVPVMTVTEVDRTSPSTAAAQELLLLGADPRAYLNIDLVIKKANLRGIVAIHPGWGFAAEDDSFPQKCEAAGITFIGPSQQAMRMLGNKVEVRKLAKRLGVPVVPGSEGAVDVPTARKVAAELGLPIMLKAEGGGGGRGIYEVYNEADLESAFSKASAMAQASFGNPRLYVEKLLTSVRHIEIQVIADTYGNVFAFDERDCTVQRNHQKLIEITPSPWPGMTEELRERLKEYAAILVKEVGYYSVCTVEFLVDREGTPYLIEVNTRLQVEHGITECRYGVDLVEEQIAIAFGARLRFNKNNTRPLLWSLQCRINCEDPQGGFSPNAGMITRYTTPGGPGIRIDSCIGPGYEFPSQYDSAAALLIAYAPTWKKTLAIMDRGLREYTIGGVKTTIPFHRQIIAHPKFQAGDHDTNFVDNTPELMCYTDLEPEELRLSRLVAEISAKGYNPYVQLGEYRTPFCKRVGTFTPVIPPMDLEAHDIPYPRGDRRAVLDMVRETREKGVIHFVDTTTRDITQSNSGNRFRLAEDRLIGPYLDSCRFFSLENGGGAHFHVAMLANMTYPFSEAHEWNQFAPKTMKQLLIRSTNVLGYKPQPINIMRKTAEKVCEEYDVIRCFDFLNHVENMKPFAEVALSENNKGNIWQPAISLSWAKGFDVPHYLGVADNLITMSAEAAGLSKKKIQRVIILALKDMGGVCPPHFVRELVTTLRKKYPELVLDYHRHYTDGLFVPAVGAAAQAGAHILDVAIGASVRWYGQGEVLSTAAYVEQEFGLSNVLNKKVIRDCNFLLKQIMPFYDRYTAPYFRGIDYDVVEHGMPGGATSSSQEGALKQGYIHLLPYMLQFLAGTRKIVRYHDVTPGSQITWNTAFLAVTGAFKRGGEREVRHLLEVLETVASVTDDKLTPAEREDRLRLYQDSNDAFRQLLLGRYGKLPLGFPPDWVYQSAFGSDWRRAVAERTTHSPLDDLADVDLAEEFKALRTRLKRHPSEEEFVMYLNHPGDALKTIEQRQTFGDANNVPLDVWFEGLEVGREITFSDSKGKPHIMTILHITRPDEGGMSVVRYVLDAEITSHQIKVAEAQGRGRTVDRAGRQEQRSGTVAAPSNGDLWVVHVQPGDFVKRGEELFNIYDHEARRRPCSPPGTAWSCASSRTPTTARTSAWSRSRRASCSSSSAPVPRLCSACRHPVTRDEYKFCPFCSQNLMEPEATDGN